MLAQRFPKITLLIVAVLTVPLALAAAKVEFSSDVREIFRSGTQGFRNLQMVEKQYPQSGEDVLLLVQADDLFTRDNLNHLRDLHLNLHFVDGVKYVSSMFSAHEPPDSSAPPRRSSRWSLTMRTCRSCAKGSWPTRSCPASSCPTTPRRRCS
ncbi:hypothetical protein AUC68_04085 [Methyloceanibacter methanicus]|uniref:Uncharacterized protein n=1 Tax=Methyloceanibacter methanicus TaxID=1774968 RepID=A0A1E3W063_9HYPH|nr:hypothetical protein [Methyloceanibacter methanicus]ODR99198.1 hypothetical protein AUC68_04085 [Methyloceanibacter methanicus]